MRPFFWKYFSFGLILLLFVLLTYFIIKYRKANDELIFLRGDTIPKTAYEMGGYGYDSKNIHYSGLSSSY